MDLPDPGIHLGSPALQTDSLPTELPGKPLGVKDYLELPAGPKMQSKDLKEGDKKVKDIVLRGVTVGTGGWSDKGNGS